jgi:hypothetical protein
MLARSEDGAPSPLPTSFALRADADGLVASFRGRYLELTPLGSGHDDDLWKGDVVELFVAPNEVDRRVYYEIEVNPAGLLFDARVESPALDRRSMTVDRGWDALGMQARSRIIRLAAGGIWLVRLRLPWRAFGLAAAPRAMAVAAYRIDRRSFDRPLFLSLAPNLRQPADFHTPAAFVRFEPAAGGR